MITFEQGPPDWLTGRSKPPTWFRLLGFLIMLVAIVEIFFKRGIAVGIVAAVVYGHLALLALLRWERMKIWSKHHPVLDSLLVVPLIFLAVAYISKIPTLICLLIAIPGGLLFIGINWARRSRRTSARPDE